MRKTKFQVHQKLQSYKLIGNTIFEEPKSQKMFQKNQIPNLWQDLKKTPKIPKLCQKLNVFLSDKIKHVFWNAKKYLSIKWELFWESEFGSRNQAIRKQEKIGLTKTSRGITVHSQTGLQLAP